MQEDRPKFIAIVVLILLAAYIMAPFEGKWPEFIANAGIKKGIDLAGGAELTYRVLFPPGYKEGDKTKISEEARDVLQRRIDRRGLKEPYLTVSGEDRIVIQLPGVDRDDLKSFKGLLEKVGKLELKAVAEEKIFKKYKASGKVPKGFEAFANPGESHGGDYAYVEDVYIVHEKPVVTGKHVIDAKDEIRLSQWGGQQLEYEVAFELNQRGAALFDEAAKKLYHQSPRGMLAIIIDGRLKCAPTVQSPKFGGRGVIYGGYTKDEAKDLAIVLKSGSLPMPIGSTDHGPGVPEAENFVGPTLGEDSINRGLMAVGIAAAAVSLFIIIYYLGGGIVAVVTLGMSLLFLTAAMSLFGATLTLPGIAGIILTVGMAVDANILIFERVREEMAKGKTASQAFESGHDRAFSAILDANVTTLIAALVLYWIGTGPVRGFAVTLSVGIVCKMFSVLFCGKAFLKMLVAGGSIRQFKMLRLVGTTNIRFTGAMRVCLLLSAVVVAGSIFFFVKSGDDKWGIDFLGGTRVNFSLREATSIDEVRGAVADIRGAESGLPK
ncbi:MAG: protein translocase subunit SecD, partial [Planctomycetota bacterium]